MILEEYRCRYPGRIVSNSKVFYKFFSNLYKNGTIHVSSESQPIHGDAKENIFQVVQLSPTTSTLRIST